MLREKEHSLFLWHWMMRLLLPILQTNNIKMIVTLQAIATY